MRMDQVFPFYLPAPTASYAALYVATLLMHALFMSYVLAGSIALGVAGARGLLGAPAVNTAWAPVLAILKDWMPFALSAAITAGIAPLLFVQILYQQEFYTANLLLFNRWMAILPVLIVAFYLLYLLKAQRIQGRRALQGGVALVAMACFLFVAWSWVENHLLSMDRAAWPGLYESRALVFKSVAILPRLAWWIAAAVPTAALLLAWQLGAGASGVSRDAAQRAMKPLAWFAGVALVAASAAAWPVLGSAAGGAEVALSIRLSIAILGIGALLQCALWLPAMAGRATGKGALTAASAGLLLFWTGALVCREASRMAVLGTEATIARHERVGANGGLLVFLVFALLGLGTIAWIVRAVARGTAGTKPPSNPAHRA